MSEDNPNANALPATAGNDSPLPASVTTDSEGSATTDFIMDLLGKETKASEDADDAAEPNAQVEGDDAETADSGEDADASDDPDETDTDDGSEAELYEVTVNGKPEKVTREELLAGYSRTRDYTTKTQQLATERQQVEAIKAQHQQALENALRYVQSDPIIAEGQKLDWAKLANDDPAGFVQKQFAYNSRIQELQQLQAQHTNALKENLEATRQREGDRLLTVIPEWKDKAKAQKGLAVLAEYLSSVGFTDQELKGFTDSRAYQVAYDAARYRKMMAAKTTVKEQQVQAPPAKTVRPGAATNGSKNTNVARIKQLDARAARTGRMDDEVDALMARI